MTNQPDNNQEHHQENEPRKSPRSFSDYVPSEAQPPAPPKPSHSPEIQASSFQMAPAVPKEFDTGSWMVDEGDNPESIFQPDVVAKSATDPLVGKVLFGTYHVLSVLGEGSMGIVYKAKHLAFDRMVALKTLKVQDPDISKRFVQEVKVHGQLKHDNICEAIDCLVAPDTQQTFFVMEFLNGTSLEDILKEKTFIEDYKDLYDIVCQTCAALEHAHNKGIVHRDLKPGNIVVLDRDGQLQVKVVDFGIAKLTQEIQRLTKTGQALGSPLYMSPEQCMGQAVDKRADVYAMGVLLFELLTGDIPFMGKSMVDTMEMHCNPGVVPEQLSTFRNDMEKVGQLETVYRTALETNPDRRYQDIAEFKKGVDFWYESIKGEIQSKQKPVLKDKPEETEVAKVATKAPPPAEKAQPASPAVPQKVHQQPGMVDNKKSLGLATVALGLIVGLLILSCVLIGVVMMFFLKPDQPAPTPAVTPAPAIAPAATPAPAASTTAPDTESSQPSSIKKQEPPAPQPVKKPTRKKAVKTPTRARKKPRKPKPRKKPAAKSSGKSSNPFDRIRKKRSY